MYNITSINLVNSDLTNLNETYNTIRESFIYYNDYFYGFATCIGCENNHLSIISDYKSTSNELIIYEIAAYLYPGAMNDNNCENPAYLQDYQTDYKFIFPHTIKNGACDYDNSLTNEEYLKNNQEFTQYKHTFKKNADKYYWYSTEVVKN